MGGGARREGYDCTERSRVDVMGDRPSEEYSREQTAGKSAARGIRKSFQLEIRESTIGRDEGREESPVLFDIPERSLALSLSRLSKRASPPRFLHILPADFAAGSSALSRRRPSPFISPE